MRPHIKRPRNYLGSPRAYFEEWHAPTISGIARVWELIEAAGGVDIFADRATGKSAKNELLPLRRLFRPEKVAERSGLAQLPVVQNGVSTSLYFKT